MFMFTCNRKITNIKFSVSGSNDPDLPNEIYGYDKKLNIYRDKIDKINCENWKKVRWYINEYDFQVKDPIINRAFYKYWEIINEFEIFEDYNENEIILHCAEAPGGFVQGSNIYLQIDRLNIGQKKEDDTDDQGFTMVKTKKKKDYKIYTISLNKDLPQYKNYNLPNYNKTIMNKYLLITYGKDNTGDINNLCNVDYIKSVSKKNFYLITADGGFDEGTDFNHKEQLHYHLILSEIYTAIMLQKNNGHFILKVFDILTETSIHLLYLLFQSYKQVYIYKPKTSRPTNSEKYIICKYFDLTNIQKESIIKELAKLSRDIFQTKSKYISFKLYNDIPQDFVDNIKHINLQMLQHQCDFLEKAIELCNDSKFITNYDNILEKSIENRRQVFYNWGKNYNLNAYV